MNVSKLASSSANEASSGGHDKDYISSPDRGQLATSAWLLATEKDKPSLL